MKSPFYFIHNAIFLIFLFLSACCLPSTSYAEDDPELEKAISYMQYKLVSDIWPKLQEPILKEGKELNFNHLQLMDEIALNKKFGTPSALSDDLAGHLSMSIEELDQVRALEASNDVKYTRALERLENISDIVDIVTLGTKTYTLAENFSKAIDQQGNLRSREEAALKGISDLFDAYVASIGVANLAARNIPKSVIFKFWAKNSLATGLKKTLSGKIAGPLGLITTLADVEGRIYTAFRDSSIAQTIKYTTNIHKNKLEARERTYQRIIDLYIEKMKKRDTIDPVELYRILEKYPTYRKKFSLITPDICRVADVYWDFLYKHNNFLQDSFGKNAASELTSRELVYVATQAMVQISVFEDNEINQFIYEKIANNATFADIIFGAFQGSDIYEIYNTDDLQNTLFPYRNSPHQFNLINKKTSSGAYGYYTVVYLAALHTAEKNAEMEMAYEIGRRIKLLRQKAEEQKRAEEYALEQQVTVVTSPNVQYESGLITADIGEQITLKLRPSFLEKGFYRDYLEKIQSGSIPVTIWAKMQDGSDYTFTGAWDANKNGFIFTIDTADPFYLTGLTYQVALPTGGEDRCGFSLANQKHVVDQSVVSLPPKDPECPAGATDIACAVGPHIVGSVDTYTAAGVSVVGNYAYLAGVYDFRVIDITDPTNPVLVGSLDHEDGMYYNISISGNYAYLTGRYFGNHVHANIKIIDISNASNPVIAGSFTINSEAHDVDVAGQYAYVATDSGLQVIDISDLNNLSVAGEITTVGDTTAIDVRGDYAYISTDEHLQVVDISDLNNISIISSINAYNAVSVSVVDNYAFIGQQSDGFSIIDVSDPYNLSRITSIDTINNAGQISVDGNYAYVHISNGVQIVDISDISNPKQISFVQIPTNYCGDIVVVGSYTYLTYSDGLMIIDISRQTAPDIIIKSLNTYTFVNDIFLSGDYIYIGRSDYLKIMDGTDLKNPVMIGSIKLPAGGATPRSIIVSDNYAYLCDIVGLKIIDISDPSDPFIVGSLKTPGNALKLVVSGKYAYIADGYNGIQIVNVSNPAAPTIISSVDTPGCALDVTISGNYAYVADSYEGIQVIDISNPANIFISGVIATSGKAQCIQIKDNYLYSSGRSFDVIDISDYANPSVVATLNDISGSDIDLAGDYAYLAGSSGLQLINISNPTDPLPVGLLNFNDAIGVNVVGGDLVYISDRFSGLHIINWQKLIQNTQLINSYYHPKISLSLTAETPSDYEFNAAPFTKTWTFSEDITDLAVTVQTDNYANRGSFTKDGNQLSVTLTPDTTVPINQLTLQFTDSGGNTVQIDHSDTFWCISRTNHAPELANGQITQMVSNFSEPAELDINTYDADGDTVVITIIDDDEGYALFDPDNPTKLVASFSDQKPIHTLRIRLNDGKETVDKEIVALRFDSGTVADFYSDVPDGHPYQADIAFATLKGVVWGQPDSSDNQKRIYRPDDPASMAEMLKIVLNAAASSGKITLPDERYYLTALPSWVGPYYTYAVKTEALDFQGTDLGQEHPTRETVAKFIAKVLGLDVKLASFDTLSTDFNDTDQFSTLRMQWYGQAVHAFGLFMAGDTANPQGTVNRGELARVVSRIFMMPSADLIAPDTVEYGTPITVSPLQNIHAEKIDASFSLVDSSNDVTAVYSINGHVSDDTVIDPVYLHSGTNTLIGALSNQGILNMYSKELTVTFTDTDVDGVQDAEDTWPNDDRYAKDINGNSIPDRLDYIYDLQDKTPSDSVVISGETMLISDLITNGPPEDVDSDGDGVYDNFDNCPYHANITQYDYDSDGLGDICDPDDDQDGMNDEWEEKNGFDPYDANDASLDSDGDGFTTKQEYDFGSNPNQFDEDANNNGIPDSIEHKNVIAPILQLLLF